uniref:Uncharacterized protein n=1 Tax=Oryza sativa subsp. japonica TaxID=39947 RepID=Q69KA8_ORYSJ|nr:hypothetical protein [Oryza sativa Japonica Group]
MAAGRGPAGWRTAGGGPAWAGGMEAGRRRPRPPLLQIRPEGERRDGGRPAAARRRPAGLRPVTGGLALPSPRSGWRGSGEMGGRPAAGWEVGRGILVVPAAGGTGSSGHGRDRSGMGWTTLHGPLVSSGSQWLGCSSEHGDGGARRRERHTGERVAARGRGVDGVRGGGGQSQRRGGGGSRRWRPVAEARRHPDLRGAVTAHGGEAAVGRGRMAAVTEVEAGADERRWSRRWGDRGRGGGGSQTSGCSHGCGSGSTLFTLPIHSNSYIDRTFT